MAEEKKRPSVADILAAARKADADKKANGDSTSAAETPPARAAASETPAAEPAAGKPAESAPAVKSVPKPAAAAKGGRPSVAEMMAAARTQKAESGAAAARPAASNSAVAPATAERPAATSSVAKSAAAKPAAVKPDAAKVAVPAAKPTAPASVASKGPAAPKGTASILAAARTAEKPGPMSKAEAATKPQPPRESAVAAKAKLAVPPMPSKPAYAVPKPAAKAEKPDEDRRGFMMLLFGSFLGIGFTSLSATTALWTLGSARFMFPNILTEPPSRFKVGFKDSLSPGQVETKYVAQYGVWICSSEYKGQKEIYALKTVCTHLGCTPNWLEGEQKFKCPCHGSGFYKDGINFEGPAPRPLERYAIRIGDDGQLEVDKSKTFHEELGQWADPASFVTV
jgi:cytochrome b6-f complex iron-sulfur subunit